MLVGEWSYNCISIHIYSNTYMYMKLSNDKIYPLQKKEMGLERAGELAFAENLGSSPNTHIADHSSL